MKQSKNDFLREWGFSEEFIKRARGFAFLRYKSPPEKGVYWYYFSLFIRQRDVEKWGTCISCNRPITVETSQAGHFMPAEDCGRDLIFDERNVNAECSHCNAWDSTHLLGYAENLDKRYGPGTAAALRERRAVYKSKKEIVKDWNRAEYSGKIQALDTFSKVMSNG